MKDDIKKVSKEMMEIENEARQQLDQEEHAIAIVEYDIKNTEEGEAFTAFQKKYVFKQNILKTVVFALIGIIFAIRIAFQPENAVYWIGLVICLAAIFIFWYNPHRIKKTLMQSLKPLEDDRYIFKLYDYKFSIETVLPEDERYDEEGKEIKIPPRVVQFDDIGLKIIEKEKMFVLFLKKDTIYVLPKRCMEDYQIQIVKKTFESKLGDDFEVETPKKK
ncbi:MAG: YcxB family protein [Ruminococcus sp.]|nr:YcxB family protein [Ruminococcus sp.]